MRTLALFAAIATVPAAAATPAACPFDGATYVSRPSAPSALAYRLVVGSVPREMGMLWRFRTMSGGRQVSEIRMRFACSNGNGACTVAPAAWPGPEGGRYSEVVRLDRDFTPTRGEEAPYAIITPGFAAGNWVFTRDELRSPDLTVAAGVDDGPNLSGQIVWLRAACGSARR